MKNRVVVSVGSNISPQENIQKAKEILSQEHTLLKVSAYLKTKPLGFSNQDDFTNCAFLVETDLEQKAFNAFLKLVEKRLKRIKTSNKNGPRTIDLDIVVWNGKVVDSDFYCRDFVKKSVSELIHL